MTGILMELVHRFGALGVGAGAALEGEAAVTLGGVLARQGLFSPIACGASACLGSFLADQLVFWLAASRRETPLLRKITEKRAFARALGWVDRNAVLFCLAFRFIYGLRIAGPAALGISHVRFRVFVPLNFLSAAVWASVFTFVGFRFGMVFRNVIAKALHTPHLAVELGGAVAVALVAVLAAYLWRDNGAAGPEEREPG